MSEGRRSRTAPSRRCLLGGGWSGVERKRRCRRTARSADFDYPRLERWPRRELWAAEAAMTLVIGAVTAVLLAAEDDLRPRKLIWLTFMATLVWLFTLHGGAAFARARGLGSMLGAVLGTGAGLIVLSLLNFWILTVLIPPRRLLLMAGAALVVSFVFQAFASDRFSKPRRVLVVGADQAAQELVHDLIESPSKRYRCVAHFDASIAFAADSGSGRERAPSQLGLRPRRAPCAALRKTNDTTRGAPAMSSGRGGESGL